MKKIINKSKLFFYTVLALIFDVNITKATGVENWGSTVKPVTIIDQSVYNSDYNIMLWLIKLLLWIFITSVVIYLFYCFKRNDKKKNRIKKIIWQSFGFFVIFVILFWMLFLAAH